MNPKTPPEGLHLAGFGVTIAQTNPPGGHFWRQNQPFSPPIGPESVPEPAL